MSPRPSPKRIPLGRWLARLLCALFVILGLLPIVAGAMLRTQYAHTWAAAETQRFLLEELGLNASFRSSLQPWPLTIIVQDVEVAGTDGSGPALQVEEITVRPQFFSLLQGRINAGEIEVDRPNLRLIIKQGKVVNLDLPSSDSPKQREPTQRAPFSSIAINDAHLDVTVDETFLRGKQIDIDVTATDGPVFDMAVRTGRIRIDRESRLEFTGYDAPEPVQAHHEDVICELDARLRIDPEGLLLRRIRLKGVADLDPALGTRPSCQIQEEDPDRVDLDLRLVRISLDEEGLSSVSGQVRTRAPLRPVNRFFPFLKTNGWAALDVSGSWYRGQSLPDLQGTVRGGGIALGVYSLASELEAELRIDSGVVSVPSARVGFADGIIQIEEAEVRPLQEGIPVRAKQLDIGGMRFPGLMRDLGVTDRTHVRMDFEQGTLSSVEGTIDPLWIDSELNTRVRGFEVFDASFDDPARRHMIGVHQGTVRSKFAVRSHAVEFQNAHVEFGNSHLKVFTSLGFSDAFRLNVYEGSYVDLENISPLIDIPWKGKAELTTAITGTYNEPLIEGDISIKGFEFAQMGLGDIQRAKVRFQPLIMDVMDVHAVKGRSAYGVPSMRMDFTGPAPIVMDAQVETHSFDIRDFLSVFRLESDPRFAGIHGLARAKARLHYEQGGPLDQCGGGWLGVQVTGSARQIDLMGEEFDEATFELDYEWFDPEAQELGVRADIRSVVLRKGKGTVVGQATIRPGGILRARAVASDLPLSEIDSLGALGPLLDTRVSATADVRGTLDRIEADVDVQLGALRLGTAMMPPSWLSVRLVPVDPPVRVMGRTRCGNQIGLPFDPVLYAKDLPAGVFEVQGELFGGQVVVQDLRVTRQANMVVTGTVVARALDLGKVAQLWPTLAGSEEIPTGVLSGALEVRHLQPDVLQEADMSLVLTALDVESSHGVVRLRQGTPPFTLKADTLTIPAVLLDFQSPRGIAGTFSTGGTIHDISQDPRLDVHAHLAPTDLSSLANVVPRIERARGVVDASLHVTGMLREPRYRGQVSLQNGALSVTGFPMPVDDIDVLVNIGERQIRLERATARMGGGRIVVHGTLPVEGFDFGTASASITARELHIPVMDGVKMTVDADLTASWNAQLSAETGGIPRVVGDLRLLSMEYTRPFKVDADIYSLAERTRRTAFELYDPSRDFVDFEVRVLASQPVRIRNNLADMKLTLDTPQLTLSGSNQRVGLQGALRVQPGSRVRLRANEFEVRDGLIRFDDPTRIAPNVDVTAVTEYRRYSGGADTAMASTGVSRAGGQWRIQMHAHGDADSLRLDLTSEPALSQEDIILLLTLGVTRAELDQMQASALGESAALEALSTLTGADSAVRESLPVIDDFRFGSAYSSRSGRTEPTVTVGKRVTERVRANVTSGLSDTREVRSNLEWQWTGASSVLGSWDNVNNVSNSNLGNLGADIRFRITFE